MTTIQKSFSMNVAYHLAQMAQTQPNAPAIILPNKQNKHKIDQILTFKELNTLSDRVAQGLSNQGVSAGQKIILLISFDIDFFIIIFSLFKMGAIPVVVDPGMGISRMLHCFSQTYPSVFIGIPKAHGLRYLFPRFFQSISHFISTGSFRLPNTISYKNLKTTPLQNPFPTYQPMPDETCAILFTSGSTGPAKGVCYTHELLNAQICHIKEHFHIFPNEIDFPTFPLFALFNPALGMTAILPDINTSQPIKSNPKKLVNAILAQHVSSIFASPILIKKIATYAREKGIVLSEINRIISAGAPILPEIIEQVATILPTSATVYSGYGATEAMPVCAIDHHEILSETAVKSRMGYGTCIGKPLNGLDVQIIKITEDPIEHVSSAQFLPLYKIGEIIVRGDIVTKSYYKNEKETRQKNITDGNTFWHRMGDVGWKDEKERIWFCGRKSHRVETNIKTYFSIPCEAIFNNHPLVCRSALVGILKNSQVVPAICIELTHKLIKKEIQKLIFQLQQLANEHTITQGITTFFCKSQFPMDIRHNAKIFREKLAVWAQQRTPLKGSLL